MRVGIVGPCAAGKTTLAVALRAAGYDARSVSQEHSCVHDLWRHAGVDYLIYLDADLPTIRGRRKVAWGSERLSVQLERLREARGAANLVIDTRALPASGVVQKACAALWEEEKIRGRRHV